MAFAWAADGTRLHYQVLGRPGAEPLLMIQGLGTDMSGWTLQRLAFSPRYRTIALDNRGAGRSDKPFGRYRWRRWRTTRSPSSTRRASTGPM